MEIAKLHLLVEEDVEKTWETRSERGFVYNGRGVFRAHGVGHPKLEPTGR